jgi:endonuclease VIII
MPEGPEVKRAADEIGKAITDRPITEIFFAFSHLKPYEQILQGQTVQSVRSKGKATLINLENQLTIYSHNQLYGKWIIRKAYSYPETNRQLRLAIHNSSRSAFLYSASAIEVLDGVAIAFHPFLSNLGPDVLDETTTVEQVVQRFQDKRFRRRNFLSLLLDQRFLCGLGNYLRSEVLFVAGLHPTHCPTDCTPEQIMQLAIAAISITQQSYQTGVLTNNLQIVAQLQQQGYHRASYRHYVFNRKDKPCFICSTLIIKAISGGRRYYYCPNCQPIASESFQRTRLFRN